jgi:hypothetical protein
LDLETYWKETPKIFQKRVEVYQEMREEQARESDAINYNLGVYIALAVNNPKKYPKKPFGDKPKALDWKQSKQMFKMLAKKNDNN